LDTLLPFDLPAIARKKVSATFDGGRITSDGGVMLLAQAERRLGIADQLAAVIPDERDADRVTHLLPDILRARIFAIACGGTRRKNPVASREGLIASVAHGQRPNRRLMKRASVTYLSFRRACAAESGEVQARAILFYY
jgi:hypothetical protein